MQTKMLGWKKQPLDHRDFKFATRSRTVRDAELPETFDLRDDPVNFPVWNQEQEGSCTGHGGPAAALFTYVKLGGARFMPARQFCYYNARLLDGDASQDSGATIRSVVKGIAQYGMPPETDWPYVPDNLASKPDQIAYADAIIHEATEYHAVDLTNINEVKAALFQGLFVVYGMNVYNQIFNAPGGVLDMPGADEAPVGGHCIALVGWTKTHLIFRNSWDVTWGDNGYGYVPIAYITNPDLASDAWVFVHISGDAPIPTPAPQPTPPVPTPVPVPVAERGLLYTTDPVPVAGATLSGAWKVVALFLLTFCGMCYGRGVNPVTHANEIRPSSGILRFAGESAVPNGNPSLVVRMNSPQSIQIPIENAGVVGIAIFADGTLRPVTIPVMESLRKASIKCVACAGSALPRAEVVDLEDDNPHPLRLRLPDPRTLILCKAQPPIYTDTGLVRKLNDKEGSFLGAAPATVYMPVCLTPGH